MDVQGFRDSVYANWTDQQTVAAWRRWHAKIARQQRNVSDALVQAAGIAPQMRVLDLGTGSGEPALQIAHALGSSGRVTATDVSDGMLGLARENAALEGLTNIDFARTDAERLPFVDSTFDAVTSRMGAMFFVDIDAALGEMRRVLKDSGRVALAVWGDPKSTTMFSALIAPFAARIAPPMPPPGAPHPLRFAEPGTLADRLVAAGFRLVTERQEVLATPWPGPPEEVWAMYDELASPPYFDELPSAERARAAEEAVENLRALADDRGVAMRSAVVIATGTR